jgi:hypothetical protein
MSLVTVFLAPRNTTLTVAWFGTVLIAGFFFVAVALALLLRSRRFWGIAIVLITIDFLLALSSACLDRFGFR